MEKVKTDLIALFVVSQLSGEGIGDGNSPTVQFSKMLGGVNLQPFLPVESPALVPNRNMGLGGLNLIFKRYLAAGDLGVQAFFLDELPYG